MAYPTILARHPDRPPRHRATTVLTIGLAPLAVAFVILAVTLATLVACTPTAATPSPSPLPTVTASTVPLRACHVCGAVYLDYDAGRDGHTVVFGHPPKETT